MKKASFEDQVEFDECRVKTKVIVETSFSKEIRILLKGGQVMKEHQTSYPILIHLLRGRIELGVGGEIHVMGGGDVVALEGGVAHDVKALEDSVVRLSLSKQDRLARLRSMMEIPRLDGV